MSSVISKRSLKVALGEYLMQIDSKCYTEQALLIAVTNVVSDYPSSGTVRIIRREWLNCEEEMSIEFALDAVSIILAGELEVAINFLTFLNIDTGTNDSKPLFKLKPKVCQVIEKERIICGKEVLFHSTDDYSRSNVVYDLSSASNHEYLVAILFALLHLDFRGQNDLDVRSYLGPRLSRLLDEQYANHLTLPNHVKIYRQFVAREQLMGVVYKHIEYQENIDMILIYNCRTLELKRIKLLEQHSILVNLTYETTVAKIDIVVVNEVALMFYRQHNSLTSTFTLLFSLYLLELKAQEIKEVETLARSNIEFSESFALAQHKRKLNENIEKCIVRNTRRLRDLESNLNSNESIARTKLIHQCSKAYLILQNNYLQDYTSHMLRIYSSIHEEYIFLMKRMLETHNIYLESRSILVSKELFERDVIVRRSATEKAQVQEVMRIRESYNYNYPILYQLSICGHIVNVRHYLRAPVYPSYAIEMQHCSHCGSSFIITERIYQDLKDYYDILTIQERITIEYGLKTIKMISRTHNPYLP